MNNEKQTRNLNRHTALFLYLFFFCSILFTVSAAAVKKFNELDIPHGLMSIYALVIFAERCTQGENERTRVGRDSWSFLPKIYTIASLVYWVHQHANTSIKYTWCRERERKRESSWKVNSTLWSSPSELTQSVSEKLVRYCCGQTRLCECTSLLFDLDSDKFV